MKTTLAIVCLFLAAYEQRPAKVGTTSGTLDIAPVKEHAEESEDCKDGGGAYWSVLRKLTPELYLSDAPEPDLKTVEAYELKASCVRDFAMTIKDPCVKQQYMQWVEVYMRGYKAMRRSIAEGKPPENGLEAEERERDRAILRFEAKHAVPSPPPSCDVGLIRRVR